MGTTGSMDNMPAAIAVMDRTRITVNSRVAVDITGTAMSLATADMVIMGTDTTASTRIAGMAIMVNMACMGIADRTSLLIAEHIMVGTTPVPADRIVTDISSLIADRKAHRHRIAAGRLPSGLAVSADRARVVPPPDRTRSFAASRSAGRMDLLREDPVA